VAKVLIDVGLGDFGLSVDGDPVFAARRHVERDDPASVGHLLLQLDRAR
jgi:hypothetical protein